MLTPDQVLGFGLAALILIAIPGPSVIFAVSRAVVYGHRLALASVVGNTLGLLTVVVLVALGLGAVVAQSQVVFTVVKLAGAAYLIWLGIQAFRHRRQTADGMTGERVALSRRRAIRQGFVVGVSNPKAFLIIAAVLPQFVAPERGAITAQMLQLGMIAVVIGLVSDSVWALAAGRARTWFAGSPRRGSALGAVGGTSMVGLGVTMALTDHH